MACLTSSLDLCPLQPSTDSEMANGDYEIVVVGGGAAGVAAARRLYTAGVKCLIIEARPRLGGRAWTVAGPSGFDLDLGCGWLHSADRNPWALVAQEQKLTIDKLRHRGGADQRSRFPKKSSANSSKRKNNFLRGSASRRPTSRTLRRRPCWSAATVGTISSTRSVPISVAPNLIRFQRATSTTTTIRA